MRKVLAWLLLPIMDLWEAHGSWLLPIGVIVAILLLVFSIISYNTGGDTPIDKTAENMDAAEVADFGPVQVYRMYDRGAVCYMARSQFSGNIAISCVSMASLVPDNGVAGSEWLNPE